MRAAFGSFRRGNARLATLGNAIEGRNVAVRFTVFTAPTVQIHPSGGRHVPLREASEATRVARPQTKRRTAQRPSREGAFGTPLFSVVSTTLLKLREERAGPWRAPRRRGVGAA